MSVGTWSKKESLLDVIVVTLCSVASQLSYNVALLLVLWRLLMSFRDLARHCDLCQSIIRSTACCFYSHNYRTNDVQSRTQLLLTAFVIRRLKSRIGSSNSKCRLHLTLTENPDSGNEAWIFLERLSVPGSSLGLVTHYPKRRYSSVHPGEHQQWLTN